MPAEFYSPDQPREPAGTSGGGQFAPVGGAGSRPSGASADTPSAMRIVEKRALDQAERLGFDTSRIDVVAFAPPGGFDIGAQHFTEAGHYDPNSQRITLYADTTGTDPAGIDGVTTHEVMHAMYDAVNRRRDLEHDQIRAMAQDNYGEFKRLFSMAGEPRPEAKAEVMERFPASAAWAGTWGDSYLGGDNSAQMIRDNGHTKYSAAYWKVVGGPDQKNYSLETAVNETLAEAARTSENAPAKWVKLGSNIRKAYQKIKNK